MFHPFCSTMSFFRTIAQFWEKCTKMTWICWILKAPRCLAQYPQRPNVQSLQYNALYDVIFSGYGQIVAKCPKVTLTPARWTLPRFIHNMPPKPKYSSVLLNDESFSSYGRMQRNCTAWPLSHLNMFKVTPPPQTHAKAQISVPKVWEKCCEWPKTKST